MDLATPAAQATAVWLSGSTPTAWRDRVRSFWTGPYAVEAHALVQVQAAAPRRFSVFRIKRHEPTALCAALRDIGWWTLDGWPYGADVGYPRALSLFRKA